MKWDFNSNFYLQYKRENVVTVAPSSFGQLSCQIFHQTVVLSPSLRSSWRRVVRQFGCHTVARSIHQLAACQSWYALCLSAYQTAEWSWLSWERINSDRSIWVMKCLCRESVHQLPVKLAQRKRKNISIIKSWNCFSTLAHTRVLAVRLNTDEWRWYECNVYAERSGK